MMGKNSKFTLSLTNQLLIVIVAITIAVTGIVTYIGYATKKNTLENSVDFAKNTIDQYRVLRAYYTEKVVSKVKANSTLGISFDHAQKSTTIPLPATMIHDLSETMDAKKGALKLKLYSEYPFPNRKSRALDDFAKEAIAYLKSQPDGIFVKNEDINGEPNVRVAIADKMVADACVNCHNNHPLSPKQDWKLGDVRGILEVDRPISLPLKQNKALVWSVSLLTIGGFLGIIALIYLALQLTNRRLMEVSGALGKTSNLVARTGSELSRTSEHLSSTTNESAAALEETSNTFDELTRAVRVNAQSAKEANQLSQVAKQSAQMGEHEIAKLIGEMESIVGSSKKIEETIGVIEDIAFQTNLLALNASVEAARAGDDGRGFAVVAESVRELAQRSSESAKQIIGMIKESGQKIDRGAKVASESGKTLKNIVENVAKASELITMIATSTQDQAENLAQLSKAVKQLDQVTQGNAARSQDFVNMSKDMLIRSEELETLVTELSQVVGKIKSEQQFQR